MPEGREFAKYLRSEEQFVQTVKSQNNFGNQLFFNLFGPGGGNLRSLTSVSKKSGQTIVVIQYYSFSRFF